jgi:hypothetical protein
LGLSHFVKENEKTPIKNVYTQIIKYLFPFAEGDCISRLSAGRPVKYYPADPVDPV